MLSRGEYTEISSSAPWISKVGRLSFFALFTTVGLSLVNLLPWGALEEAAPRLAVFRSVERVAFWHGISAVIMSSVLGYAIGHRRPAWASVVSQK